jgi:hypothetical protein
MMERAEVTSAVVLMASLIPHPNPPPQGGRRFIAPVISKVPFPLEGEGREGGELP